ncbi:ABC transporter substrate-binding protein [Amycolatopsis ultiminotia]|uniref:ABC transporter substrate-binding protein n=1 Tax=Amycolatopsis ultiminotia TaxID=543629 RepID=A0ABP6V3N0_9PSEU
MKIVLGRDDLAAAAVEAAASAGAAAERLDVRPVHKASRGFLQEGTADVCELAVVTLLQAVAYDKPVALLPITALGRHQHQTLVTLGEPGVGAVRGRTVGVRSWSQTTGVWLRGFLTEQYGVELSEVDWIGYEDGHVPEYADPAWVKRAPEGAKLPADFLDGRVDYGIMGNELPADERIRTAVPDALTVASEWAAGKGFAPINHVVAINPAVDAKAALAVYDALAAAVEPTQGPVNLNPVGFEALRGPVTEVARYAREQEVLPRAVSFDELVDRTCAALGVRASRLGG